MFLAAVAYPGSQTATNKLQQTNNFVGGLSLFTIIDSDKRNSYNCAAGTPIIKFI